MKFLRRLFFSLSESLETPFHRWVKRSPDATSRSHLRLHLFGYVLIAYSLVEFASFLFPIQLTDPSWELRAQGFLVEQVWGLLLGIILVFYRPMPEIRRAELQFLGFFSWLVLLLGVGYLLLIPLGIVNTQRLNRLQARAHTEQRRQQTQQYEQLQSRLAQGNLSNFQLAILASSLQMTPEGEGSLTQQLSDRVEQNYRRARTQLDEQRRQQRRQLFRNAIKWNFGSLVIGVTSIWIWALSGDYRSDARRG